MHVRDIGDVKYLNKDQRQHCTKQCYSCRRCRRCEISQCYVITVLRYFTSSITLCIIIQTIRIKKYFELMLRIT